MNEFKEINVNELEVSDMIIEKLKIRNQKEKKLLESNEYMNWLDNFTKFNSSFNDEYSYAKEKFQPEDLEKVRDLCILYGVIDDYARANYISAMPCNWGQFYCIKFNETGYHIGLIVGQGAVNFCERVELENESEFIDFKDIQENKNPERTVVINKKLDILSDYVKNLIEKDKVPSNAIMALLKDVISEFK